MDSWIPLVITAVAVFAAGFMFGRRGAPAFESAVRTVQTFAAAPGRFKLVMCVRKDLQMTKGKIAAQCAHSALGAYRKILKNDEGTANAWLACGQPKIALQIADEEEMTALYKKAVSAGVNAYIVHDAGRTQVAAGSATVLAVGPAPEAKVDEITSHLKLL